MVVSADLGPYSSSWLVGGSPDRWEVVSPNNGLGGTIIEVRESIEGVNSSSRTPQWRTLELAVRIGRQHLGVLVDSGLTGNYIDA